MKTTAFSALNAHFRSFKAPAKCSKHNCIAKQYSNIFNVLIKITSRVPVQADSSLVDTIFGVFDDIEENIENQQAVQKKAELQRIEVFDELFAYLGKQIQGIKQAINALESRASLTAQSLYSYQKQYDAEVDAEAAYTQQQEDNNASCDAESDAFNLENFEITGQITICGQAVYLLENKIDFIMRYN